VLHEITRLSGSRRRWTQTDARLEGAEFDMRDNLLCGAASHVEASVE